MTESKIVRSKNGGISRSSRVQLLQQLREEDAYTQQLNVRAVEAELVSSTLYEEMSTLDLEIALMQKVAANVAKEREIEEMEQTNETVKQQVTAKKKYLVTLKKNYVV